MSMELLQRIKRMEERIANLEEKVNNQPIAPSRDAQEVKNGKRPYNRKPK